MHNKSVAKVGRSVQLEGECRETCQALLQWPRFFLFDAPGEAAGIQGADSDLIGFEGANLTDPGDAETGFAVPAAFYFDDVAGSGEVGDALQASAVFANVDGIRGLREGIAIAVFSANDDFESLRRTRSTASFPPEHGNGCLEGESHAEAALVMRLLENDFDLLFFAGKFVDDE